MNHIFFLILFFINSTNLFAFFIGEPSLPPEATAILLSNGMNEDFLTENLLGKTRVLYEPDREVQKDKKVSPRQKRIKQWLNAMSPKQQNYIYKATTEEKRSFYTITNKTIILSDPVDIQNESDEVFVFFADDIKVFLHITCLLKIIGNKNNNQDMNYAAMQALFKLLSKGKNILATDDLMALLRENFCNAYINEMVPLSEFPKVISIQTGITKISLSVLLENLEETILKKNYLEKPMKRSLQKVFTVLSDLFFKALSESNNES